LGEEEETEKKKGGIFGLGVTDYVVDKVLDGVIAVKEAIIGSPKQDEEKDLKEDKDTKWETKDFDFWT